MFAGLCAVGFLARASYALARTPVLALFAAALGAGPEGVGLAVAVSTLTGVFFKLPAGALSDVVGRARMLLAGLAVFALAPLAYLAISSLAGLVVVRFVHGLATAIYGPVVMAVVVEMAGSRRGEWLSWFSSVTIIGNLVGAPLGGLLLTLLAGGEPYRLEHFQAVYGVVAALGMASLLTGLLLLRGASSVRAGDPPRSLGSIWRQLRAGTREILFNRRVLLTSNMEGVQNLSVGALEAFLPIYAVQVAGLSAFEAGILWGVQVGSTILSKPLMGRWSDQRGRHALIFWGMFACALPFAAIPWVSGFGALLALCALFGLGEAVVTSSTAALVADLCRADHLGSAMGTFGTVYDVGHASGPLLAGVLIAAFGGQDYRAPFALIALLLALSALAFRWGVREMPTASVE